MRIVVTGGAGFIGSALVLRLVGAGHHVLTLDKLTYAGRLDALDSVRESPRHRFVRGDICDAALVVDVLRDFDPDAIVHLAAESHVDRSIDGPAAFIDTNVRGTGVLLEAARRHWSALPRERRGAFRFIHVSTDEVFGSLGATGTFGPASRYAPNSPYAASKAASDHLARAWHATYGLPVIVTNCSNNYGPRQHAEKLIPTVIRHAIEGAPIPIYGDGSNTRDWLYVEDHVAGLETVLERGRPGETYLFGGRAERTNLTMAHALCTALDEALPRERSYADLITLVADRPGHDFRYAVDPGATERSLGWSAATSVDDGLRHTVRWYLDNRSWLTPVASLGRLGRSADVEAVS